LYIRPTHPGLLLGCPSCTMKFGKRYEQELFPSLALAIDLPAFPYKEAKKKLKAVDSSPAGSEVFIGFLDMKLRRLDSMWAAAARHAINSARKPQTIAALSKLGLARRPSGVQQAKALNAWAELSREAMRKILKKFNKAQARAGAVGHTDAIAGLAFVSSPTRTELEYLSQETENTAHECPVCLDVLFQPVAPACGHAVCRECFDEMRKSAGSTLGAVRCPICRGPASTAPTKLPIAAAAVKAADPAGHAARKQALADAEAAALAKKYAGKINAMPMQVWM